MFRDFRPADGWELVYGYIGAEPGQVIVQTVPVAGWLQDDENVWWPGVVDLTSDLGAPYSHVEFSRDFLSRVMDLVGPVVSLLVPPTRESEEVSRLIADHLFETRPRD